MNRARNWFCLFEVNCMDSNHNYKFKMFIFPLGCVGTVSVNMESATQADALLVPIHSNARIHILSL